MDSELDELFDDGVDNAPSFDDIMSGEAQNKPKTGGKKKKSAAMEETITVSEASGFTPITVFEQKSVNYFTDKSFYQKILSGCEGVAAAVHKNLGLFLKAESSEDRSIYRKRLSSQFWELARTIAPLAGGEIIKPKQLMLRYGVLLPTLISKEQRELLGTIVWDSNLGEPFYYADEWLRAIAVGDATPSASDEPLSSTGKGHENIKLKHAFEKAKGIKDSNMNMIKKKQSEIIRLETQMGNSVRLLSDKGTSNDFPSLNKPYSAGQKKALMNIPEIAKQINLCDRELSSSFGKLDHAVRELNVLEKKMDKAGMETAVDNAIVEQEFDNMRQMVKMCIGRQGNHFPILMKAYCPHNLQQIATKENVSETLRRIETLDPSVFERTFRQQTNRIVPFVFILPCFGDKGMCWEPFDRFNRSTSRGRISVPLYPKDIFVAVVYAVADLRWQVAKEKAGHYWMEEGITGNYYQWFSGNKMKGDVRLSFIEDYILWLTKESEGVQKVDKEVRGIFWRNMPFPDSVKEDLRKRAFVYDELCKKDLNRTLSTGY